MKKSSPLTAPSYFFLTWEIHPIHYPTKDQEIFQNVDPIDHRWDSEITEEMISTDPLIPPKIKATQAS